MLVSLAGPSLSRSSALDDTAASQREGRVEREQDARFSLIHQPVGSFFFESRSNLLARRSSTPPLRSLTFFFLGAATTSSSSSPSSSSSSIALALALPLPLAAPFAPPAAFLLAPAPRAATGRFLAPGAA